MKHTEWTDGMNAVPTKTTRNVGIAFIQSAAENKWVGGTDRMNAVPTKTTHNVGLAFIQSAAENKWVRGMIGRGKPSPLQYIVCILLFLFILPTQAQETPTPTPEADYIVYVTTQDFVVFREGPGRAFNKILTIDPVVTLPAIGRSTDSRWIQVIYEGRSGWLFWKYLVWTGNVINLPVDGVATAAFVRRATAVGYTTRVTPLYASAVTPEDQVGELAAGTQVELTGRLGGEIGAGFFQLQIKVDNNLYWVGSWNININGGNYLRLLDTAYLIPYGRILRTLESNVAQSITSYDQIHGVWSRLDSGAGVSCEVIPLRIRRLLNEGDSRKEPSFAPPLVALEQAIVGINEAIDTFETVCADPSAVITRNDVQDALTTLDDAERYLILAGSLIEPLRVRNPLTFKDGVE